MSRNLNGEELQEGRKADIAQEDEMDKAGLQMVQSFRLMNFMR